MIEKLKKVNPIWLVFIIILLAYLPVILYNTFDFWKDCTNCKCNSYLDADFVKSGSEFSDTIRTMEIQRTVQYLLFCDGGFPLGQDDDEDFIDETVIDFISFGNTTATKLKNENIITFVRYDRDTLRIEFTSGSDVLKDFKIIK